MGRYYDGNINGKFWFGVQSTNDGEFFGMQEDTPSMISYYSNDLETAKERLGDCKKALGNNLSRLNAFFNKSKGYNNEMIVNWYKDNYNKAVTLEDIKEMLTWFARYELGKKIVKAIEDEGECYYNAEF